MDNYDIIKELSDTTALAKRNETQIAELHNDVAEIKKENQAIHDIATSVKLIAQDMTYIKSDIATVKETQADLTEQVSNLKEEPARTKAQWVDKAIGAVCGVVGMAILAYVLNNLTNIFS